MVKQKLQLELKNAPSDASQMRRSANLSLNRDESLSVAGTILNCNNPKVNQPQQTGGLKANVFVFSPR